MDTRSRVAAHFPRIAASAFAVLVAAYSASVASDEIKVVLSGNQEIPPVVTSASGIGTIAVGRGPVRHRQRDGVRNVSDGGPYS